MVLRRTRRHPVLHPRSGCPVHELSALGGEAEHVGREERRELRLVVVGDLVRGGDPAHFLLERRLR